jgi:hypothetical protein
MLDADDAILLDAAPDRRRHDGATVSEWGGLAEPVQLMLAASALRRAAATLTFQAETLAREMETGGLQDRGGPDALRLLATLVRVTSEGDAA